ncbi:hypothetical protein AKO1_007538 [Acrasis kona]|uniref:Reverse transcriptase domain-containing protein n=1 Tax=Acrasis kona TaxID=1008807 RepID=A0AAW2YQM4_9EUKA
MKPDKEQTEWMRIHVSIILNKKFIRTVPESMRNHCYISPWHLVPKPRTTWRHIINMKTVNPNFHAPSFKMECTSMLSRMLQKGMWATKWVLVSGYNHAAMHKDTWKLLTFEFEGTLYQYITLPFGLNTAPSEFSKIVGEAVKILRKEGILIFFYLDDFLVLARTREKCKTATARFLTVMQDLGFIFARSKSMVEPTQLVEHLGVGYNLLEGYSFATPKKVQNISDMINQAMKSSRAKTTFVSKMVGKINFAGCTLDPTISTPHSITTNEESGSKRKPLEGQHEHRYTNQTRPNGNSKPTFHSQLHSVRARHPFHSSEQRCHHNSLWRCVRGQDYNGEMANGSRGALDQHVRTDSIREDLRFNNPEENTFRHNSSACVYRQYDCQIIHTKGLWKNQSSTGCCEKNMVQVQGGKHLDQEGILDTDTSQQQV